jgi:hypothetical protein
MAQKLIFGHKGVKLLGQLQNCHVGPHAVAVCVVSSLTLWLIICALKCASYNSRYIC